MNNFVFHNPVKILFGKDTIAAIGTETKEYGTNVLLVHGQNALRQNGTLSQIEDSLYASGCRIAYHGEVPPNPTVKCVHEGVKIFRQNSCEVICAAGGGSVIDTAKAISCAVPVEHDVWKFFTTKKKIRSVTPLTCVATVAGSGSESNSGMVITNEYTQQKFGYGNRLLFPKVSILNPETTFSVPPQQTVYGAVDIIAHLVELYCNNSIESPIVQNGIMESLIKSVMNSVEAVLQNPSDYAARAQLMWAASLSLNGLTSAGLGRVSMPVHLIEPSLAALHDTNHGAGLSLILPSWIKYTAAIRPEKTAQLGRRLFALKMNNAEAAASLTADRFKEWFVKIGCPLSLANLDISRDRLSLISENTQALAKIWRIPDYSSKAVLKILNLCYAGTDL
ncbi:MAG: iron-containing alcohol dehydrogenase [Desulfopila sp.]|nr:iron-containing alcohol dehydrogenase [Desulfopila sp.]